MTFIELTIKIGYRLLGLKFGPDQAPDFDKEQINKILVVRNDNLGDVLLTVPALRALRQTFPKAYLAVLVNAYTLPALEGIPWIDKVYSYDKFKHGKHPTRLHAWLQQYHLIKELQEKGFDLAIGIRSGFSSSHAHLVYSSAARWRVGHTPKANKKNLGFFYNIKLDKTTPKRHEVERSLDVVRAIGVDTFDKELEFFIPLKCKQEIDGWIAQQNFAKPIIGILLSQRLEAGRYWNTENYIELIKAVQQGKELTPVLIYAKADETTAQKILAPLKTSSSSFTTPDLKVLAALLERCDSVVTIDGGGMHIATAVHTPTIAIFAKTDPLVWAPWGKGHIVLKKGDSANMVTAQDVLTALNRNRD